MPDPRKGDAWFWWPEFPGYGCPWKPQKVRFPAILSVAGADCFLPPVAVV